MTKTYKIIRKYKEFGHPENGKVIKTELTLKEARDHYNDPNTSKRDVWFDTYHEEDESLQEMIQQVAQLVNNMGFDYEKNAEIIAKALIRGHRTLQQGITQLLAGSITKYAELSYHDPRNESAVEWAKKVAEIENYFPCI